MTNIRVNLGERSYDIRVDEAGGLGAFTRARVQGSLALLVGAAFLGLHALATREVELPPALREKCLDFIDTLWNAEGGFHGHWADDHLDAEYTFYGLLALGHLAVGAASGQ